MNTQTKKMKLWEKVASIIFALVLWQLAAMALNSPLLLVSPIRVLQQLVVLMQTKLFYTSVMFSLVRIVLGFLIGCFVGTVLATLAAAYRPVQVFLWPYIVVIKTIPVASFIILCLIWLDAKNLSIFTAFLMVLPIVYTNMLEGITQTNKQTLEMAKVFHVGTLKKILYIYLPSIKPYLITAFNVSLGLSWKAGIAAEVIGIPSGSIGEQLYEAKVYLSSPDLFAWTAVIIIVSMIFEKVFLKLINFAYTKLEKN